MTSRKRRLAADSSSTETSAPKRAAVAVTPRDMQLFAHDRSLFFGAVPRDIVAALTPFIWRLRGTVANPNALQFERVFHCAGARTRPGCGSSGISALCFDAADNVIVTRHSADQVHVYTQQGVFLRLIGTAYDHHTPSACVADLRGRVFVAEEDTNTVNVFCADGSLERTIAAGLLDWPRGMALSPDETVLYVPTYMNCAVQCCNAVTGELLHLIGEGRGRVEGVATLSTGCVALSSGCFLGMVSLFTPAGELLRTFGAGGLSTPGQIAVDAEDNMYVTSESRNAIVVYSSVGRMIGTVKRECQGPDEEPLRSDGIAIDSTGRMAMTEWDGALVLFFK